VIYTQYIVCPVVGELIAIADGKPKFHKDEIKVQVGEDTYLMLSTRGKRFETNQGFLIDGEIDITAHEEDSKNAVTMKVAIGEVEEDIYTLSVFGAMKVSEHI